MVLSRIGVGQVRMIISRIPGRPRPALRMVLNRIQAPSTIRRRLQYVFPTMVAGAASWEAVFRGGRQSRGPPNRGDPKWRKPKPRNAR